MREGKRRILSILTALALALGLCTPLGGLLPEAEAAEIVDSGKFDPNMTWTLDSEGTLTIHGDGSMYNYGSSTESHRWSVESVAWHKYRDEIRRVVIGEGITFLCPYAFQDCVNLTSVSLPDSLIGISLHGFSGCTRLTNIAIPNGVESISNGAFLGAGLESVYIPDSVDMIDMNAFLGCTSLKTARLPQSMDEPGDDFREHAFRDCTSLVSVNIPDGVTELAYSFYGCSSLKSVYIPASVTNMVETFRDSGLEDIYYAGTQAQWEAIDQGNNFTYPNGVTIHYNAGAPELPELEPQPTPEPEVPTSFIPTPILDEPTCTKEGVSLSWTLPLEVPDQPHTVDGFYILRKTAGGSYQRIGQVGAYTHLYADTSVQEGQTYTYTVQAYYQDRTGDYDQSGRTVVYASPSARLKSVEFSYKTMTIPTGVLGQRNTTEVTLELEEDISVPQTGLKVELVNRDTGARLWQSNEVTYTSDGDSFRFEFTFQPDACTGGYLPYGLDVRFRLLDAGGTEILTYDCETFPIQTWGISNPKTSVDEAFLQEIYGKSRAKSIMKLANKDSLGGNGLCVGMSLLVSLINSDGIGDIGFSGCTELGQVKQDTPLTGAMKGFTALDLIKACHARQYFDSIVRQREENFEDLTGLVEAVEDYQEGKGVMPVIIIKVKEGTEDYVHAMAAYAVRRFPGMEDVCYVYVYDPNYPNMVGHYVEIYDFTSADPSWSYHVQTYNGSTQVNAFNDPEGYGLTYFTSRSYPMQQEDDIWVSISGYDFSTLKDGGLDITALDPDRFQGLNAAWVSGQGTLSLSSLTAQAEIADDETFYTIDANGGSTELTLKEGVDSIHVTGEGTLTITCDYEGENSAVTTRFSGTAKDGVSVSRNGDTVRFSGGESGTVTVTYENGKTWTEQVEPGKDLSVTADGRNEPSTDGKNEPTTGGKNESSTNGTVSQAPDSVRFFDDISSDDYFYDAVVWAVERGVTTGTGPNTFSPYRPCTRAEVVTLLWRALGLDEGSVRSTHNPFADVDDGDYFRDAVLWAAEYGITTGTNERHFSPDKACTRAEVVTFLWRSHFPMEVVMDEGSFRDVNAWDYYYLPVNWAVKEGITTGTGEGTFSPDMVCTRSQVVTFLYRYFGD